MPPQNILSMINLQNIDTVIFDLGGVLFDIDYHLSAKAFEDLGIPDFKQLYSQAHQNTWFDDFEIGKINQQQLLSYLHQTIPGNHLDADFIRCWNAMLLGMDPIKFNTLKKIRPHFKLFLLSNANELHLPQVERMIEEKNPGQTLHAHFDQLYFSHLIGLRKPNPDSFLKIINEHNLSIEKTLFLDDSIQHVEGAKAIGLNAALITKEFNTEVVFSQFLL